MSWCRLNCAILKDVQSLGHHRVGNSAKQRTWGQYGDEKRPSHPLPNRFYKNLVRCKNKKHMSSVLLTVVALKPHHHCNGHGSVRWYYFLSPLSEL